MSAILESLPKAVPRRANCYLRGLSLGWVLTQQIGHADSDEIKDLLPPSDDGVIESIPFGGKPHDPEVEALDEDYIIEQQRKSWSFSLWMGIKHDLYHYRRVGQEIPDEAVMAWLGYLRGELEGHGITQAEYDDLRAMFPAVDDDLTPLVAATV